MLCMGRFVLQKVHITPPMKFLEGLRYIYIYITSNYCAEEERALRMWESQLTQLPWYHVTSFHRDPGNLREKFRNLHRFTGHHCEFQSYRTLHQTTRGVVFSHVVIDSHIFEPGSWQPSKHMYQGGMRCFCQAVKASLKCMKRIPSPLFTGSCRYAATTCKAS